MKQKLLTLMTLLVLCVTGAWGQTTFDFSEGSTTGLTIEKSGTVANVEYAVTNEKYASKISPLSTGNYFLGMSFINNGGGILDVTTTESFSNIESISFDTAASDNGKPTMEVFIVDANDNETKVLASMAVSSGSTNTWRSTKSTVYTIDLSSSPKTGKVHFKFTSSSSGKFGAIDNIVITEAAPATPTLTGAWMRNDDAVTEADVIVQGGSVTMPTFTVGATSGNPSGKYNVSYAFKSGYQSGIFEESEGNPTITSNQPSIASTAVTGTATIVATLITTDAKSFAQPTTNTFEYTVTINAPAAPTFEPDASAVVSGTAITMTSPDGGEIWYTTTGEDPTESNKTVYDEEDKPTITGTTTIKAIARVNGYSSAVTTAEYTLVTLLEEATSVNTAKTWDWTKVSGDNVSELSSSTTPTNTEEFVYDNLRILYNLTFTDPFDATALLVKGKNVWDGGAFRAGGSSYIKINFTVPGLVKVTYSNTGKNTTRYASVNGTRVGSGSSKNSEGVTTGSIHVTTGVTTIAGLQGDTGSEGGDVRIRKIEFIPDVPITVTTAGLATYASDYNLDFSGVTGIKAYKASISDKTITFTKMDKVPAGEGMLIRAMSTLDEKTTFYVPVTTDVTAIDVNKMKRGENKTVAYNQDGVYNYVLSGGENGVGFYQANGEKVPTDRAYLQSTAALAKGFVINYDDEEGEETDGIKAVSTKVENGVRYNLAGQKVGADYKGIVIVNGKKIVRK